MFTYNEERQAMRFPSPVHHKGDTYYSINKRFPSLPLYEWGQAEFHGLETNINNENKHTYNSFPYSFVEVLDRTMPMDDESIHKDAPVQDDAPAQDDTPNNNASAREGTATSELSYNGETPSYIANALGALGIEDEDKDDTEPVPVQEQEPILFDPSHGPGRRPILFDPTRGPYSKVTNAIAEAKMQCSDACHRVAQAVHTDACTTSDRQAAMEHLRGPLFHAYSLAKRQRDVVIEMADKERDETVATLREALDAAGPGKSRLSNFTDRASLHARLYWVKGYHAVYVQNVRFRARHDCASLTDLWSRTEKYVLFYLNGYAPF